MGVEMSAEELLSKLDTDGNGTLEMGEMPTPDKAGFGGPPPPFIAEDGSVQDSPKDLESFNSISSLLSYLSSDDEDSTSMTIEMQA